VFCENQEMADSEYEENDDFDRARRALPHRFRFIGLVRNAWALDIPRHPLPPAFAEARALLRAEGDSAMERAVALLAPYFGCAFDACNVDPELEDFLGLRGDMYDAVRVNLESVEFDEPEDESESGASGGEVGGEVGGETDVADVQTLPFASGAAWFELPAGIKRSTEEMKAWQEANSYLDCGLRFFWRIPGETPRDHPREYDLSDVLRLWVEFVEEGAAGREDDLSAELEDAQEDEQQDEREDEQDDEQDDDDDGEFEDEESEEDSDVDSDVDSNGDLDGTDGEDGEEGEDD
jgi:hypothetical protein